MRPAGMAGLSFAVQAIPFRVIGQNVLVKTAATIEISMDAAVISFFREDIRWTKRVGKILGIC